ncbi:hypothetical protein BHM03_00019882 [Ensete ventricosum]|nr:hypothetical protein BHM03_00019882 [Ensete ventricosum]
MPIREACHVAVQKNHPNKQKLWKHAQARQRAKGQGPIAVLQIGSLDNERFLWPRFGHSNGEYSTVRTKYSLLSLPLSLGLGGCHLIRVLPQGKGVSSSASVEVATMSAIAAAHVPAIENEKSSSECHYSYSECGLGSNGTDRLVKLLPSSELILRCPLPSPPWGDASQVRPAARSARPAAWRQRLGRWGSSPRRSVRTSLKETVQNRQAKVTVVPSAAALVIKALRQPERDRKKTENIKHNGNISLDDVVEIARVMPPRTMAKDLAGTFVSAQGPP